LGLKKYWNRCSDNPKIAKRDSMLKSIYIRKARAYFGPKTKRKGIKSWKVIFTGEGGLIFLRFEKTHP